MKHARSDYDHIQDPNNKIPADEPVFLLRGQDVNAPHAVRMYAAAHRRSGGSHDLADMAEAQAEAMEEWQNDNKFAGKVADLPK